MLFDTAFRGFEQKAVEGKQSCLVQWGKTDGHSSQNGNVTVGHTWCHEPRTVHSLQFSLHLWIGCTILGPDKAQPGSADHFTLDQEQFDFHLLWQQPRKLVYPWKSRSLECILKEFGLVPGHRAIHLRLLESSIFCRFCSQSCSDQRKGQVQKGRF